MLFGAISSNIHNNITIVFVIMEDEGQKDLKKSVSITKQLGKFKMIWRGQKIKARLESDW